MHVLILCEYGTINGGERSLLAALDHRSDDVQVTVLAPKQGRLADALAARGVVHVPFDVHDASGRRLPAAEVLDALLPVIERHAPEIVHANSLSLGRITGVLSHRISVPCTAHLRDIVRLSHKAAEDLNGNARLITVSHATRDYHVAQGLDAGRVTVLHNGIDCEQWRPRSRRGGLRGELDLPADALVAAAVGQIGIRKGLDVLVDMAILEAESLPRVHYAVIGERYSGKAESIAFEQSLHDRLEEVGIADRFHWLGYREDVGRLLGEADLLIHSARQEPFGRVLLEAAACGLPIIATRVGGTAEMLNDGQSALFVEPDDAGALAQAVHHLISNPEERRRLGDAARRRMVERFDIREQAAALFALWRNVRL
ncbi:MAG: glycosyltransferase family 4 protein [Planctomycetaceae bacterium]